MTLGMAASISMSEMIGCRSQSGRQLRKINRRRDAQRDGDEEGEERGNQGAEDERQRAVDIVARVPIRADEEAEAELLDRQGANRSRAASRRCR